MLMLWSIMKAISRKNKASLTFGCLWYSSFTTYVANDIVKKNWTADCLHACTSAILQSQDFNLCREHALKIPYPKLIWWPYFFNAKKLFEQQQKQNVCAKLWKRTVKWNFSIIEISIFLIGAKSAPQKFFLIFPVSSPLCNKKIFIKKYGSLA